MTKTNRYISAADAKSEITRAFLATTIKSGSKKNVYLKARYKRRILIVSHKDENEPDYEYLSLYYFWNDDFDYAFDIFSIKGDLLRVTEFGAVFCIPSMFRKD